MSKKVPEHISAMYVQGAHGFRKEKRAELRRLEKCLNDLRAGCAYFPCHEYEVNKIQEAVKAMKIALSVKVWGR